MPHTLISIAEYLDNNFTVLILLTSLVENIYLLIRHWTTDDVHGLVVCTAIFMVLPSLKSLGRFLAEI